jgi:monoamine oxidase
MSRSLASILYGLFGPRRSEAELAAMREPAIQSLHDQLLLPEDLLLDRCDLSRSTVAVVGGGLAGLCAAWYLQQCGVQVTVFEAADRAGGRVRTDDAFIPGRVVEAGAELIGDNHPMWLTLASRFDLELRPITKDEDYEADKLEVRIRFGDRDLDDDEKQQLHQNLTQVYDVIGQDARDVDPVAPWNSPGAEELDRRRVDQRLDEICERLFGPESTLPRAAMELMLANDNCAETSEQSYLGLLALVSAARFPDPNAPEDPDGLRGYWNFTETCRCFGGNDQLASSLAGTLADLRLSTKVTGIFVTIDNVGIALDGSDVPGETFDFVVLSTPPSVWADIRIESPSGFDPARFTMSHGPAVKYLSSFPSRFWADQGLAPKASWDQLGSVWESTDQQPADPDIGDFGLTAYSGGPLVLAEQDYPGRLGVIYPGFAPTDARFVDWPNTPNILTGNSVPSPGQVTTISPALNAPFDDRLFFAGEQSCVPFFGYMEGALQSGARAARDVIAAICPDALGR